MTDRFYNGSSEGEIESQKPEYGNQHNEAEDLVHTKGYLSDPRDAHHSLHRRLNARQVTMIAIGGALGTGLIIGTGQALVHSGPGSILISYSLIGLLCYSVMTALGEMATWLPAAGGFAAYASRVSIHVLGTMIVAAHNETVLRSSPRFRAGLYILVQVHHHHAKSINRCSAGDSVLGTSRTGQSWSVHSRFPGRDHCCQLSGHSILRRD